MHNDTPSLLCEVSVILSVTYAECLCTECRLENSRGQDYFCVFLDQEDMKSTSDILKKKKSGIYSRGLDYKTLDISVNN
jgi:hypothetical protein